MLVSGAGVADVRVRNAARSGPHPSSHAHRGNPHFAAISCRFAQSSGLSRAAERTTFFEQSYLREFKMVIAAPVSH